MTSMTPIDYFVEWTIRKHPIEYILKVSSQIKAERNINSVMCKVMEEIGEVAVEVNTQSGMGYKPGQIDGITEESIDAIISLVDLIYLSNPDIKIEDIMKIVKAKTDKWAAKTDTILE